jgi:RNA polymerase sigma factor (sigma-70 family)
MKQVFLYKDKDDFQVWNELKNGNSLSFEIIYKKHYELLYNYGLNIVNEKDIVEDAIQELFIKIWKRKEKLADVHSIRFYLLVSFRRLLLKKIVKAKKQLMDELNENNDTAVDSFEQVLITNQSNAETKKLLAKNIGKLSPRQKEIIYLKFYKSLSYQEISVIMGINNQSVRNLIFEAIRSLKEHLLKKDSHKEHTKSK